MRKLLFILSAVMAVQTSALSVRIGGFAGGAIVLNKDATAVRPYVFMAEIHRTTLRDAKDAAIDAMSDEDAKKACERKDVKDSQGNPVPPLEISQEEAKKADAYKNKLKEEFMYARNYGALLHDKEGKTAVFIESTSNGPRLKVHPSKVKGGYVLAGALAQVGFYSVDNIDFSVDVGVAEGLGCITEKSDIVTIKRSMSVTPIVGLSVKYSINSQFAVAGGVFGTWYNENISVVASPKGIDLGRLNPIDTKKLHEARKAKDGQAVDAKEDKNEGAIISQDGMIADIKAVFAALDASKEADNTFSTKRAVAPGMRVEFIYNINEQLSSGIGVAYIFGVTADVEDADNLKAKNTPAKLVLSSNREVSNKHLSVKDIKVPAIQRRGLLMVTANVSYKVM